MENGRFTPQERDMLLALDAVEAVNGQRIVYSLEFKRECMRRYHAGEGPGAIFASAGLPASLIGYKRIELAFYHWRKAEARGRLCSAGAAGAGDGSGAAADGSSACGGAGRGRADGGSEVDRLEDRLRRQEERAERRLEEALARKDRQIARRDARIKALESQVKALKANGSSARRGRRAPGTTEKTVRFEIIHRLRAADPQFDVKAACEALEVSRSGYYDWVKAADRRRARLEADERDAALVAEAATSHRARKGSRQIVSTLRRDRGVVMNRKKVQRLSRRYGPWWRPRRRNPYHPLDQDGQPRTAPNLADRDFRRGLPYKVLSTDITYLPCRAARHGFVYLSGVIDCQTNRILAHTASESMAEPLVLDTLDQLKGLPVTPGTLLCSDQGVHYTARAYRDKIAELGVTQSMSRRACCWDNAPIESFWGRLKEQIGPTAGMSVAELTKAIDDYIDYYNTLRAQSRLGGRTPAEYEQTLLASPQE